MFDVAAERGRSSREHVKCSVLLYGAAELFSMKVRQGLSVGCVCGQSFEALEVEERAVELVRAALCDDVDAAALSGEGYLVAVRPLHDCDVGGERQKVFKLAAKNRKIADGFFINGRARLRACGVNGLDGGDGYRLLKPGDLHLKVEIRGLPDAQRELLLLERRKARLRRRQRVTARRKLKEDEAPVVRDFVRFVPTFLTSTIAPGTDAPATS